MEKNKSQSKKYLNNKAITLIALIITIIIMLILVAVSIQIVINSDLLGVAKDAKDKMKTAYEEEGKKGEVEINGKKYASIEDYIKEQQKQDANHNWQYTDTTKVAVRCECDVCKEDESGDGTGRTLNIAQELYTEKGIVSSTISGERTGVPKGIEDGNLSETQYGEDGEQTISRDYETKWIVFGVEDSDGNGTNETLLLTTDKPTKQDITLCGAAAYNNVITIGSEIGVIDQICKELYGSDVRGMTLDDILNTLDYELIGTSYRQMGSPRGFVEGLDITFKEFATTVMGWSEEDYNTNTATYVHPDGVSDIGETVITGVCLSYDSTDGTISYFGNKSTTAKSMNETQRLLIFGNDEERSFMLASRCEIPETADGILWFGPYWVGGSYIRGSGSAYDVGAFGSTGESFGSDGGVRPIRPLKGKIPSTGSTIVTGSEPEAPEAAQIGDYVNYEPTEDTYEVTTDKSGYSEKQIFTTETGVYGLKWRILSLDDGEGNMLLVADRPTSDQLILYGETGWENAADIIEGFCAELYDNDTIGATARSYNSYGVTGYIGGNETVEKNGDSFEYLSGESFWIPVMFSGSTSMWSYKWVECYGQEDNTMLLYSTDETGEMQGSAAVLPVIIIPNVELEYDVDNSTEEEIHWKIQ